MERASNKLCNSPPSEWRETGEGGGSQGEMGQEVYGILGRRERGWEAGFRRWGEAGERQKIMQHCAVFWHRNIAKRQEPEKPKK